MNNIDLDQIATILDALGQAAGNTHIQYLAIAGIVLSALGTVLHRLRAAQAPAAVVQAAAVEVAKPVDTKVVDTLEALDSLLKK